jgi:hypothetical protein
MRLRWRYPNSVDWSSSAVAYVYATGRYVDAAGRSRPVGITKCITFAQGVGHRGLDVMRYPTELFCATGVIGGFTLTLPRLKPKAGSYGGIL